MSKGLDIILEKIEANPDHATMVERFLQLAAELPDGMEKADAILRLARALKARYPEDALELVRQVFDQRDASWVSDTAGFEIKALHHLREIFLVMGHPGKSEVIALEIRKVEEGITNRRRMAMDKLPQTNEPTSPLAPSALKVTKPPAGQTVPAAVMPEPPPQNHHKPSANAPPKPPSKNAKAPPRARFAPKKAEPATAPALAPKATKTPPLPKSGQEPQASGRAGKQIEELPFKDIKKLLQFFDQYFKKPTEKEDTPPPKPSFAELLPQPTPPIPAFAAESDARHDFEYTQNVETFWRPLYSFLVGDGTADEQRMTERLMYLYRALSWPTPESRVLQTVERFRRLEMVVDKEDGREQLAICMWVDWGVETTQRLLVAARLEASMLPFWTFTLDRLMAQGRHRMALALIRATLRASFSEDWGREAYARLLAIWPALEVDGFNWKEREGMADFVERLALRERPHVARILA